jgi:prevent-host-death family protein
MTDRFIDIEEAKSRLANLIERVARGESLVITREGRPLARLGPPEAVTGHREKESRRGVTLPPEYEASDVRVARISREGEVPYRLRKTPKH